MKIKEIQERETDALQQELKDRQKHLFDLRTQAVTEKLEDPTQLLKTRRDIARILTVLRQRQLEAASKPAAKSKTTARKADQHKSPKRTPKRASKKKPATATSSAAAE